MSTQTMAASSRRPYSRQDSYSSAPPLRPQPSSPTLTNPDMILPDYDEPEPEPLDSQIRNGGMTDWDSSSSCPHRFILDDDTPHSNGYPLTTPIIYGNGTMLSDIGEVTEVESNAGGLSRLTSRSRLSDHDAALRSSPTMGGSPHIKKPLGMSRERRSSMESTSTITTQKDRTFPDFDDVVSVDDSNFQGDDEESLASSFVDDTPLSHQSSLRQISALRQGQSNDRYSTSSISRRAEQILANAKRRLTTMEDNLTRARTFSYSSVSDGSTPSPNRPGTATRLSNPKSPLHSRNVSENRLTTTSKATHVTARSASALGAAGGYRQPFTASKSTDAIGRPSHGISELPLDLALEPLSEDDAGQGMSGEPFPRSVSAAQMRGIQDQMNGLKGKIHTLREQALADSMKRRSLQSLRIPSPFTHSPWEHVVVEKKQPQEPELNPPPALGSPFRPEFPVGQTGIPEAPEKGYGDDEEALEPQYHMEKGLVVARHSPVHNLHRAYMHDEIGKRPNGEVKEVVGRNAVTPESTKQENGVDDDGEDDLQTEYGDATEELEGRAVNGDGPADSDTVSESGDSLYHEALQYSVSHEDRADAFDYEHFFLYSAMGSLSRQGNRGEDDSDSVCSEGSVETTRAMPQGLQRRNSMDTLTSVDTFATAREGRSSRSSIVEAAEDGRPESPVVGTMLDSQPVIDKRATIGGGESGSSSEDSRTSQERYKHQRSWSYRPGGAAGGLAVRHGLNRPSVSSFESTGTNRSFPLVNKSRLGGSTTTSPRDSPDHALRARFSPMSQNSNSRETEMAKGTMNGTPSPLLPLTLEDQAAADRVLSSLGKCVNALRDKSEPGTASHETYRRRLEAARQILDGHADSFDFSETHLGVLKLTTSYETAQGA